MKTDGALQEILIYSEAYKKQDQDYTEVLTTVAHLGDNIYMTLPL